MPPPSHRDPAHPGPLAISTTDYHTAGEPFRIVTGGMPAVEGATVLERRRDIAERLDHVRRLLVNEPRGHADMYGAFVVPPDDAGADLGVVFFHNEGYSTACGHGTIALVTWALEAGVLAPAGPATPVTVDVPSGRLSCVARWDGAGRVRAVRFRNVPSFVLAAGIEVGTSLGTVRVDVAFGGAFYGSVDVRSLGAGLAVDAASLPRLIALQRELRPALEAALEVVHPLEPALHGIYGIIFWQDEPAEKGPEEPVEPGSEPAEPANEPAGPTTEPAEPADEPAGPTSQPAEPADRPFEPGDGPALVQRNVTVFADGEVDRSPCGSGTSARLALLAAEGRLRKGQELRHLSIVDSVFGGWIVDTTSVAGMPAVVTEVEGSAYHTGDHHFVLDAADPLGTGFLLR